MQVNPKYRPIGDTNQNHSGNYDFGKVTLNDKGRLFVSVLAAAEYNAPSGSTRFPRFNKPQIPMSLHSLRSSCVNSMINLVPMCPACNTRKSNKGKPLGSLVESDPSGPASKKRKR